MSKIKRFLERSPAEAHDYPMSETYRGGLSVGCDDRAARRPGRRLAARVLSDHQFMARLKQGLGMYLDDDPSTATVAELAAVKQQVVALQRELDLVMQGRRATPSPRPNGDSWTFPGVPDGDA